MAKKEMDDDKDNAEGGEEKKLGGKKVFVIVLVLLLLLGGAGAGLYFSGMLGGKKDGAEEETPAAQEHAAADSHGGSAKGEKGKAGEGGANVIPGGPAYYELPEFLVNLNTGGQNVSFLKMKVTMELSSAAAIPIVEAHKPKIMDAFNTYLRELRASDLAGSAGIYRLREELILRVNKAIEPEQVKDILFNEIIVQ